MNKKLMIFLVLCAVALHWGMSRRGQYDEEAREQERIRKQTEDASELPAESENHPARNFARGIKEATVNNTKDAIGDTIEGTISEKPIVGTLDGAQKGGSKVIDTTIKSVKKVVSFGYSKDPSYEVNEPSEHSGDAAKIKLFKF